MHYLFLKLKSVHEIHDKNLMCQNFCITQDSQQHIDIHYVTVVKMRFAYYFYLKVTPVDRCFFLI